MAGKFLPVRNNFGDFFKESQNLTSCLNIPGKVQHSTYGGQAVRIERLSRGNN